MVGARGKDFWKEAPKISRVAGAARRPEQLNLDELLPGKVHAWDRIEAREYGYVAHCACGFRSRERISRPEAHAELRHHLGRTPQGSILSRNLRRLGRGGTGA
jgi:hypothetical protein